MSPDAVASPPRRAAGPVRVLVVVALTYAIEIALFALALGGLNALLHHPRALTLIALDLITTGVLSWVRPVRDQDVIELAAESPQRLLMLLLIPMLTPPLSAWCEHARFALVPGGEALRWGGVALVVGGLALRLGAMGTLGRRFSPRLALQREHTLETRGLYARVRHPGYLGSLLACLGGALAFGSGVGVAATLLMLWLLRARIVREEDLLVRRFGDEYERYRAATWALWPRLWGPSPRGV